MRYFPEFVRLMNKYLYEEQGQTQTWLAQKLGVTSAAVSRWLDGSSRPKSPEMVIQIADILRVYDQSKRYELLFSVGYGILPFHPTPPPNKVLGSIQNQVAFLFSQLEDTLFVDHGLAHANRALAHLELLLKNITSALNGPLNSSEIFIAEAAILLHNVGLCVSPLSSSPYLTELYVGRDLNSLPLQEHFFVLTKHWAELSAEMILSNPQKLGLIDTDPLTEIATLIRFLAQDLKSIPPKQHITAHKGQTIRIYLLTGLVRLALSLEIAIDTSVGTPTPLLMNDPEEVKIRQWMRYYTETVEIQPQYICAHWKVPCEEYFPHITNAHYDYFIRGWSETIDVLRHYGWSPFLSPPQIGLDTNKAKLPEELFATLRNRERLEKTLRVMEDFLGGSEEELPAITPYYYGAILERPIFTWDLEMDEETIFEVNVTDLTTNKIVWEQTNIRASRLPYSDNVEKLLPDQRYRWAIYTYKKGSFQDGIAGIFWLLDPKTHNALSTAIANLSDQPETERQLSLAELYRVAKSYGPAVACLKQVITREPTSVLGVLARRQLADLYESIANQLSDLAQQSEAESFLMMADNEYKILRELCVQ